jgi:hypothetical protein
MKNESTKLASILPEGILPKPKQKEKEPSEKEKRENSIQKNRESYLNNVQKRHQSLPGELLSAMKSAKTKCAAKRLLRLHLRQVQGF